MENLHLFQYLQDVSAFLNAVDYLSGLLAVADVRVFDAVFYAVLAQRLVQSSDRRHAHADHAVVEVELLRLGAGIDDEAAVLDLKQLGSGQQADVLLLGKLLERTAVDRVKLAAYLVCHLDHRHLRVSPCEELRGVNADKAVGTAATFLIFSGVLAAIGIAYFIFERKKTVAGCIAVILICALGFGVPSYSFAFWENDLALEDESIYNYLQVKDDAHQTVLATNVLFGVQSVQPKDAELTGMYYDYALAAPCMAGLDGSDSSGRSVMILGMGSGTFASYCTRYFPGISVKGAEIDGKIADIAHEYFSLPDSVEVAVADGRAFLSASDELFDVIMVDAYQDITIPFQLSSVEFFSEVSRHLKPEGVMVVNLNMTSRENGSLNEYLCDTMASVFKRTYIADVAGNTNTEVFCTNADTLEQTFDESRAKLTNARYAEMMATVAQRLTEYTGGSNILTDDKAPVELLGMRVLDELIAGELSYYKSNFSMDDIMGMLGA